jgi:hypothetical protein
METASSCHAFPGRVKRDADQATEVTEQKLQKFLLNLSAQEMILHFDVLCPVVELQVLCQFHH